jgi:hypothetical protein
LKSFSSVYKKRDLISHFSTLLIRPISVAISKYVHKPGMFNLESADFPLNEHGTLEITGTNKWK